MDPVMSRLGQIGAKIGALALLTAVAAYVLSRDPIALLVLPMLIGIVELLCLVEGPWTAPLLRRLRADPRRHRVPRWPVRA